MEIVVDMTDCYRMNGAGSVQEVTIRKSYELSTRRATINTVFVHVGSSRNSMKIQTTKNGGKKIVFQNGQN